MGTPLHCWWGYNFHKHLGKQSTSSRKYLFSNPTIPLLNVHVGATLVNVCVPGKHVENVDSIVCNQKIKTKHETTQMSINDMMDK